MATDNNNRFSDQPSAFTAEQNTVSQGSFYCCLYLKRVLRTNFHHHSQNNSIVESNNFTAVLEKNSNNTQQSGSLYSPQPQLASFKVPSKRISACQPGKPPKTSVTAQQSQVCWVVSHSRGVQGNQFLIVSDEF